MAFIMIICAVLYFGWKIGSELFVLFAWLAVMALAYGYIVSLIQ